MQLIGVIHVLIVSKELRRDDAGVAVAAIAHEFVAARFAKNLRHFRRASTVAQILQNLNEPLIGLTEDFLEFDGGADARAPRRRLEAKLFPRRRGVFVLANGRELEKVAAEDERDTAKGFVGGFHRASDRFQFVEKVPIDHGDLVYDQISEDEYILINYDAFRKYSYK